MLLDFEKIHVNNEWFVRETSSPLFVRVYYVLSGTVTYTDAHTRTMLKKDHVYLFPTAIPYTMEQDKNDQLYCVYLHLDILPDLIDEIISFDCKAHPIVRAVFEAIDAAIAREKSSAEPLVASLSEVLLTYADQCGGIRKNSKGLGQAVSYIASHFSEEISVETLSTLCGYHEKYFIRLFSEVFGRSPYQYLIHYRLNRSCYLLKAGVSVTETAYACGYKDAKSYCRAFHRMFGITPGTYGSSKWIVP